MSKKKGKAIHPRARDLDFEFDNSSTWIDGDKQSQSRPSPEAFVQRTRVIRVGIRVSPPSSPSPSPPPPEVEEPASTPTSFAPDWLKAQRQIHELTRQPSALPEATPSRPSPTASPAISRSVGKSSGAHQSFAGPSSYRVRRPHSNASDDRLGEHRSCPEPASSPPQFDTEPGLSQPDETHAHEEPGRGGLRRLAPQLLDTCIPECYASGAEDASHQSEDTHESGTPELEGFYSLNELKKAERPSSPPTSTFSVPMIDHPEFLEMFFGTSRSSNIMHIADKTSTYLSRREEPDEEPKIEMWGNTSQIAKAKRDLQDLAEYVQHRLGRPRKSEKWDKIKTEPTEYKALKLLNKARTEARKKKFRNSPEEGTCFDAVGVFLWPDKKIDPKLQLGTKLRALNDIKDDCEVYILYSPRKQMFRVLGDNKENVVQALDRLYAVYCENVAERREPTIVCLVEPPKNLSGTSVEVRNEHELVGKNIRFKTYERKTAVMVYPAGPEPSEEYRHLWSSKSEKLRKANDFYMRRIMQRALGDAYYTRAYCNLKIYFGQMVLFRYKEKKNVVYELQEFFDILRDPKAKAEVIRSIGEDVAKELIKECNNKCEIFHPVDAVPALLADPYQFGYDPDDDDDGNNNGGVSVKIEPAICATLEIKLYNSKGKIDDVRLEVKFERIPGKHPDDISNDAGELYRAGARRWLKLHATNAAPSTSHDRKQAEDPTPPEGFSRRKGLADIKVADLENDVAWQMELVSYPICEEKPDFPEFERNLRIEEIPDEWDPQGPPVLGHPDTRRKVKRVLYTNLPHLQVQAVTMKTKWSYWINRTPYVFEVTKYEYLSGEMVRDRFQYGVAKSFKGLKVPTDTRWGAALWSDKWKMALSQQVGLRAGVTAKWDCDLASFFKSSGVPGWEWRGKQKQREAERMTRMKDEDEEIPGVDPWDGNGWKECMERIREVVRMIKGAEKRSKREHLGSGLARGEANGTWNGPAEYDV